MPLDYRNLMQWPFPAVTRHYSTEESQRVARGFGAGTPGELYKDDAVFIEGCKALPSMAVALADGEFWQMNPAAGIDWRRIVHAEEGITVHRPLPPSGTVVVTQSIEEIFDRGADKGAVMQQKQLLSAQDGTPLVTITVTTVLKGDGGFGGKPYNLARREIPQERACDATLRIRSQADDRDAIFRLSPDLAVAEHIGPGKSMMRGLGCFGLASRGVLKLVCENQPERLKRMTVRYAGPMFTDELMLIELWHLRPGQALFRMSAPERNGSVLDNCYVEFDVSTLKT